MNIKVYVLFTTYYVIPKLHIICYDKLQKQSKSYYDDPPLQIIQELLPWRDKSFEVILEINHFCKLN